MELLTCVKSRGWDDAFSEDVRYGPDNSGNPASYSEPLLSLRQSLEDSKLCLKTLNEVKTRLGRNIRLLQRRTIPLVLEDGIKRLPTELLAHIFEAGFHMTENSEFISIRVSHVSRLFRDISLRTPRLWTRHSTDHGLDQIHAFLSRSGHCNIQVEITSFPKADMGSFLQLLAPHSNRWSRLTLDDCELDPIFQELGLFNLPRLRFLCHRSPTDLCAFNLPMLSHIMVEKDFWYQNLPFQSQLTWVELFLHQFTSNETAELALALYQMRGLRDLSLEFVDCNPFHPAYHHDGAGIHEPHTFPIESLSITISGSPKRGFVTGLYDALSYFVATTVDISLQFDPPVRNAHTFIFGSTLGWFPYASMISIHTPLSCDVLYILENIARHCAIAQSVRFEVSTITDFEHTFDFQNLGSIQHLHIRNCDTLSEKVVEKLAKNLSLLTLEITTCKMISEEFLLNVSDEVGEKIKWAI